METCMVLPPRVKVADAPLRVTVALGGRTESESPVAVVASDDMEETELPWGREVSEDNSDEFSKE